MNDDMKVDGGPAFPQSGFASELGRKYDSKDCGGSGLSLRDYFAAKAIQGLICNEEAMQAAAFFGLEKTKTSELLSKMAYAIADGMLKARQS